MEAVTRWTIIVVGSLVGAGLVVVVVVAFMSIFPHPPRRV